MIFQDCSEKTLRKRIQRYGFQCGWCGRRLGRDFHHIQPKEVGGSDRWDNLIWVCETCHTLLDEFCRRHWNDSEQKKRMRKIRSCSIDSTLQFCEGKINKKRSTEQWNFANIFEMGKEGKMADRKRTADDVWQDLREAKKYMKIDGSMCLQYLQALVGHLGEATHVIGMDGKGPVVIAAPSLEALLERAKELQGQAEQHKDAGTPEEAIRQYKEYKQCEDDFFHTVFRPS